VLERSTWILLATGDQGTNRPPSQELSHRVRSDGRFTRVGNWPWSQGRHVELWQRQGQPASGGQGPATIGKRQQNPSHPAPFATRSERLLSKLERQQSPPPIARRWRRCLGPGS
jgi:hypothetical protein